MTEFHIVVTRTCTACGLIRDKVPLARKREAERDEQDEDPGPRGDTRGEGGSMTRLGWWAYGFFVGALAVLLAVVYGWLLGDCTR
jgi:hypothetical protein